MKNLKYVLAFLSLSLLYSCLDTEEKIVLNQDNSGTYSLTLDLGRMLKLANSMGAGQSDSGKIKEKKDTTVYLKDLVNSADLTPAEKELYKGGVIYMKMDEANNDIKVVMSAPFKNTADLATIKNHLPEIMDKLKAFEKASGEKPALDEDGDNAMGSKSVNPVADQFTFLAAPGKISNTINNIEAFKKKVATDSTLTMLTQMTSMMGDFNYRTVIVLPKAVKGYDGPGSSISADKKTLTFFTTLSEMLEHPEKVSYKLEY